MSCAIRAFALNNFISLECVEEALHEMRVSCTRNNDILTAAFPELHSSSLISFTRNGMLVEMLVRGDLPHDFMKNFTAAHDRIVQETIERLRRQEREIRERAVLENIGKDEALKEERRLREERMELESLIMEQEEEKKRIIEQKRNAIIEKAKQLGYTISEGVRADERRLVLVRRS